MTKSPNPLERMAWWPLWALRRGVLAVADLLFMGSHRGRPLVVQVYRGYGSAHGIWLRGRVLEDGGVTEVHEGTPAWENLRNMYRRFRSRAIAGAEVALRVGEVEKRLITDGRGFFQTALDPLALPPSEDGWHEVVVDLLEPRPEAAVQGRGRVLVPARGSRFGVISDVDDTVVYTYAFDKVRMVRILLFDNAHARLPFPGVAAFYRALERGGGAHNPILYVSSSAWNVYDLLRDFMRLNDLPAGPLLLRDMRFSRAGLFGGRRHEHKLDRIREVLATWPDLPFLLIGDSGQHDPELYLRVVQEHPGRVAAIYLRDVVRTRARHEEIEGIAEEVRAHGSEALLVEDTFAAARHAAEHGWIDAADLEAIDAERRGDMPPQAQTLR